MKKQVCATGRDADAGVYCTVISSAEAAVTCVAGPIGTVSPRSDGVGVACGSGRDWPAQGHR